MSRIRQFFNQITLINVADFDDEVEEAEEFKTNETIKMSDLEAV